MPQIRVNNRLSDVATSDRVLRQRLPNAPIAPRPVSVGNRHTLPSSFPDLATSEARGVFVFNSPFAAYGAAGPFLASQAAANAPDGPCITVAAAPPAAAAHGAAAGPRMTTPGPSTAAAAPRIATPGPSTAAAGPRIATPGPSAAATGGPSAVALGKKRKRDGDDDGDAVRISQTAGRYRGVLMGMYRFLDVEETTVEQTAILLDIARLETYAARLRVALLRVLAKICDASRRQAEIDFGRVQDQIDLNLATANSLQDTVHAHREAHGRNVVNTMVDHSDDSDLDLEAWDPIAEASSTVAEEQSVAGGSLSPSHPTVYDLSSDI